jgi:hypothetical protein
MRTTMRSVLLALLPLAVLGARKRDVASTPFQLYAYSEEIGGFPLFYADGLAYLGESALSNSTDAAVVTCKFSFFVRSSTHVHQTNKHSHTRCQQTVHRKSQHYHRY